MTGTGRQGHDDGSGFGQTQRTAGNTTYTAKRNAYRAFFEHSTDCVDCGHGQTRCEEATKLWRAWHKLPS